MGVSDALRSSISGSAAPHPNTIVCFCRWRPARACLRRCSPLGRLMRSARSNSGPAIPRGRPSPDRAFSRSRRRRWWRIVGLQSSPRRAGCAMTVAMTEGTSSAGAALRPYGEKVLVPTLGPSGLALALDVRRPKARPFAKASEPPLPTVSPAEGSASAHSARTDFGRTPSPTCPAPCAPLPANASHFPGRRRRTMQAGRRRVAARWPEAIALQAGSRTPIREPGPMQLILS